MGIKWVWVGLIIPLFLGCAKDLDLRVDRHTHDDTQNILKTAEYQRDQHRFSAKPLYPYDVESYALKGAYHWTRHELDATVAIRLKLEDPTLTHILLDSAVSRVSSIQLDATRPLSFQITAQTILVSLETLSAEEKKRPITLSIRYQAKANNTVHGDASSIMEVSQRRGDPNFSRVVYTTSEPLNAIEWLPCHNHPSDRALFSSEFTMDPHESLIANGDLILDTRTPKERRMKYATRYSLPTYLMAIGIGEFETSTTYLNTLPVSVWHRKGLAVDTQGVLRHLTTIITHFEKLLIPYPFEKYTLVLLPEFRSGGIEHAGITFQAEHRSSSGLSSSDFGLTAHELGHQWFGDYVTVAEWDDLWIKEGMATLLAEEASRFFDDQAPNHRLFGRNFYIADGEAIWDPTLAPEAKYNSGPYGKSAWLLTQIRRSVGESIFWGTLRQILNDHALGTISTAEFIQAFSGPLGPLMTSKVEKAILGKTLPQIDVSHLDPTRLHIEIKDPDEIMILPLEAIRHEGLGGKSVDSLLSNHRVELDIRNTVMLSFDPTDTHALDSISWTGKDTNAILAEFLAPTGVSEIKLFNALNSNEQIHALNLSSRWSLKPSEWKIATADLKSAEAWWLMIQAGCQSAANEKDLVMRSEWRTLLETSLIAPHYLGISARTIDHGLSNCRDILSPNLFSRQLQSVQQARHSLAFHDMELVLLANVNQLASDALDTWRNLVTYGPTVRSQVIALMALEKYWKLSAFQPIAPADKPTWVLFYESIVNQSDCIESLTPALEALVHFKMPSSLSSLKTAIQRSDQPRLQSLAMCSAYKITQGTPALWTDFTQSLAGHLSPWLNDYVVSPEKYCH